MLSVLGWLLSVWQTSVCTATECGGEQGGGMCDCRPVLNGARNFASMGTGDGGARQPRAGQPICCQGVPLCCCRAQVCAVYCLLLNNAMTQVLLNIAMTKVGI